MTTLHVLSNPHGITAPQYTLDPFSQAVSKFVTHMTQRGWPVVHYGHELSQVPCENVAVTGVDQVPEYPVQNVVQQKPEVLDHFNRTANQHLRARVEPRDIVLCYWGRGHQAAVSDLRTARICEPSIGYDPQYVFAPYRVFVSYAQMHYYYGYHQMLSSPSWFDHVIGNGVDMDQFDHTQPRDDYLLLLGRVNPDKGVLLAIQVALETGMRLVIAGPGSPSSVGLSSWPPGVEHVGFCNAEQRRQWLSRARALLAPTYYLEPFGNVVVEALASGTPVITSDWGGFADTVQQGVTGWRCRDFGDFVRAVNSIDSISSQRCRDWAQQNFSDPVVHQQFDRYMTKLQYLDFYHQ
jgi:glycosyltransferase involved in cell wall biosynthesis